MKYRMLVAVVAALIGARAALAQNPTPAPAPVPVTRTAEPAWWVSADFLLGRINGPANPISFLTTSPAGTPRAQAGVLGLNSTSTLFGATPSEANGFNEDPRVGFRVGAGMAITNDLSAELGFVTLERQATVYSAQSDGSTILARPYIDPTGNVPQSLLVAFPGVSAGSIDFSVSSSVYLSGNLDLYETFCDKGWIRFDSMIGYRFIRYDGGFTATQTISPLGGNFVPGTSITTRDELFSQNEFHGAEVGLRTRFLWDDFTLALEAKVAGGNLRRRVRINGTQNVAIPGATSQVNSGGFYALASNIGTLNENSMTAVPEFSAALRWRVMSNLNLRLGYTLTMLGNAVSPEHQLDTTINPDLLPPANRDPVVGDRPRLQRMIKEDVWVQFLQLGAELVW